MSLQRSISKPISLILAITQVQTQSADFHSPHKWKAVIILKLIKKCFILGSLSDVHFAQRWLECVLTRECLSDPIHVHRSRASWEICTKLDFKQTWVRLMRCWSGGQVCGQKTSWPNSLFLVLTHPGWWQLKAEMTNFSSVWWWD